MCDAAAVAIGEGSLRPEREPGFRGDIQGLRAVAVLLVLGFHAGLPSFGGGFIGVDVFFVISGFLITGLIVKEIEHAGRFSLTRFYARRARRLLPAAALTLAVVAVITVVLLPPTRFSAIAGDVAASALYVVNWRFARAAVDYFQSEDAPSPVQHYWSLAVEEQFYLVWPVLILALLAAHRRTTGIPLRHTMLFGIVAIGASSFAWSLHLTGADASDAFFVSTTRIWELAIGAALAIGRDRIARVPQRVAAALGASGVIAIVAASVAYRGTTPFPGLAALAPTLGTAAVLVAGSAHPDGWLPRVLGLRVMQACGAISYSLYLWHWPLVVGATALWARDGRTLAPSIGVATVAVAVLPAWLTYRFIEMPLHHAGIFIRRLSTALALGAVCMAVGLVGATAILLSARDETVVADILAPGAAVLGTHVAARADSYIVAAPPAVVPSPRRASQDVPVLGKKRSACIPERKGTRLVICDHGKPNADVVIGVVGDSKMHQWMPALQRIAAANGWLLRTFLKSTCPQVGGRVRDEKGGPLEACTEFNEKRLAALLADTALDYVLLSHRATGLYLADDESEEGRRAAMAAALAETWAALERSGRRVIVLLDNPQPALDVMECVSQNPGRLGACAFERAAGELSSGASTQRRALELAPGVRSIDMTDYFCPGKMCPAVIGNVLVYRRGSHVTKTYIESLTPVLERELRRAMRAP